MDTQFISQLHQDSFAYLGRLWHQLNWNTPQPAGGPPTWVGIDWNGSGKPSAAVPLEGDQCLVFFLGGIQVTSATGVNDCIGFATDQKNPAGILDRTTGKPLDRVEPFFDFQSSRLKRVHQTVTDPNNVYFSYIDAYEKAPFAYFSSYKKANGYNRYFASLKASDCNTLGVWPYSDGIKYHNSDTFQIISAGRDGIFGQGSNPGTNPPPTWTPATADSSQALLPYRPGTKVLAGSDDMSDFYDRMLGVPSN
jgi:general secretion pathway protein G